ncbi:energy-coupling factor transporter ATPase [Candidatus Epulonipiscium fishelsonii]|uniref:Energy-coupling factor transporter ATPase n=1 Tax=Candidatus Epulonipiscium fishelsonii TaxID=77094 RepID=A0ACC8XAJ0_9FIRM|nr:energy-coupling factor transporter ATPase [Epulopiscium sp. SCG-B11WGA-EpuloA1]ONI40108.1 energy-coupling factor transporter ATPase [Epulopiscium sp. SCG-B05WGA-EpuloA1]
MIIDAKNLIYEYINEEENGIIDKVRALDDFSIEVKEGEFLIVLGHNGSGKSTFAKHLNGILRPTDGTLFVDGFDMKDESIVWQVRSNVGMVFQNPDNQIVATIVEEDVAFGPENLGVPSKEIRERVDRALRLVEMEEYKRHSPNQLSGGQKQRIAIAGIIAMEPKCIVFDESTAMLDPMGRRQVMETMNKLNKEHGITIIHITHHMEEAIMADRIIVIEQGKMILEGSPKDVFKNVEQLKNIGLDVPDATYLAYLLNKEGIKINTKVINTEEVIKELCQLK